MFVTNLVSSSIYEKETSNKTSDPWPNNASFSMRAYIACKQNAVHSNSGLCMLRYAVEKVCCGGVATVTDTCRLVSVGH